MDDKGEGARPDERVYAEQVDLLYSNQPIGISATVLNATIIIIVLWSFIAHSFLVSWALALILVSFARTLVMLRYRTEPDRETRARKWGMLFLLGMACAGLVWGVCTLWIFQISEIELHMLIAFVIGGMTAGASATLSALRAAFYLFAIPAFLPLSIAFFFFNDLIHISMGIMMLIFLTFLGFNAHSLHRLTQRSFGLRHEKDELIVRLEQSRLETESTLDSLRREIRKRGEAEQGLRALSGNLEREVRARTRELEHANRELNAFAYSVSHDLRAPLRAIQGFSRALEQDFRELLGQKGCRYLDMVLRSAERMSDLIDELLSLSRVSRQQLRLETCDLSRIAHEVAGTLQRIDPARQADFAIQEGLTEHCDCGLIRIVLENLLGNAWKFTRKTQRANIEFGALIEEDRSAFFVADNGVGFEMAYAGKLFAPFQRLHSEEEFEGTGIGLATVQRIIHRHGGSIWAEAEPGKGAKFYFALPKSVD